MKDKIKKIIKDKEFYKLIINISLYLINFVLICKVLDNKEKILEMLQDEQQFSYEATIVTIILISIIAFVTFGKSITLLKKIQRNNK